MWIHSRSLKRTNLYDCVPPSTKAEWQAMRKHDCDDSFTADSAQNAFPRYCCDKHKKHDQREPSLLRGETR